MKIKNIGVDADGILTNLDLWQYAIGLEKFYVIELMDLLYSGKFSKLQDLFDYFEISFYKKHGFVFNIEKTLADFGAYEMKKIFGVSKLTETMKFATPFLRDYCKIYNFRENASPIMNKWKEEGRKLHIITARKKIDDKSFAPLRDYIRSAFLEQLEVQNIPYDTITYCVEKGSPIAKYEACKKYDIDLMLEDKPENIEFLRLYTGLTCFEATYNVNSESCKHENVFMVGDDFIGADRIVQEIESGKQKVKKNYFKAA